MATYIRQIWCGFLSACAKNVAGWVFWGGVKNPAWVSLLDFLRAPWHGARRKSNFRTHATWVGGFLRLCEDSGIWVFMPSAKNMAQKMYRCTSCAIFPGTAFVVRALNGREWALMAALRPSIVSPLFFNDLFWRIFDEAPKLLIRTRLAQQPRKMCP